MSSEQKKTTSIGVQLRLVKATDVSFIPATDQGKSKTTGKGFWIESIRQSPILNLPRSF